ncbi:maltoporin LamB [Corallincola luteus]|uniref:Maltoporin LamB n=1 Tax=Corallincola luteus TaxID=1775177 RepID=A0ABY2AQQ3_9GAMM|nr:maltoporin LamB [Corallincola luteus]TCI05516.1 maltoporin LamB [Corallincola luteus]
MKKINSKILPLASAVAMAVISSHAAAIEFHGYGRAGLSTTTNGGDQACFGSGGGGHWVGRLGDECDTYMEIGLGQEVYNRDGVTFKVESMISYRQFNQGNDYQSVAGEKAGDSNSWSGGDTALRQLNVQATGLFDFAPESTLWMGKRFYQRKDVHIMDLYYVNNSGYGVGLEGIGIGPGKLSLAWTQMDSEDASLILDGVEIDEPTNDRANVQHNKLDVRYAGIPLWGSAQLELIGIYGWTDFTDDQEDANDYLDKQDDDGMFFTAEVSHALMGGFNKVVFQYSTDALAESGWGNHGGGNVWHDGWTEASEKTFRILDWGVVKLHQDVDLGYAFLYQKADQNGMSANGRDEKERVSAVLRPSYKWNNYTKTTLELGYDRVKQGHWADDERGRDLDSGVDLYKVVVAQEFTAGRGFFARPALRLYAGSFWGDQAKNNYFLDREPDDGHTGTSDYNGIDGEVRFGAQVEAWW